MKGEKETNKGTEKKEEKKKKKSRKERGKVINVENGTMVENCQEYRLRYWATRSSVRSFARTAHFAPSLARCYFVCVFFLFSTIVQSVQRAGSQVGVVHIRNQLLAKSP